jgi:ankyrin repeat protein
MVTDKLFGYFSQLMPRSRQRTPMEIVPFMWPRELGILRSFKSLTDTGANVKATDNLELTALHRTARSGHVVCIQVLHKCGAEIKATGYRSFRPLHAAVKYSHCSTVEFLLIKGASIDAGTDDDGCTPLSIAIQQDRVDVVKLLLKRGANPNLPEDKWTPLKWPHS